MSQSNTDWVLPVVLLAAVAAGAWWYFRAPPVEPTAAPDVPEAAEAEPKKPRGPLYPVPSLEAPDVVDLPPLDDSDSYFELALGGVLGAGIDDLLVEAGLIDRFVATVDNLTRKHVAESIRPFKRLPGTFIADRAGGNKLFTISPENFARYAGLVDQLANADMDVIIDTYRRFYPLLQQAYVRLGYPNGYFNDRAIEVIDHLLETPEADAPIMLVRPNVLYEFADPELEALSSGQKLLLRTGKRNTIRIKSFLTTLRSRLASFD